MPSRYTQRILDHLSNKRYQPVDANELVRQLRIDGDHEEMFTNELGRLLSEDTVVLGTNDVIQLPSFPDEFEGRIKITAKGFGFVIPDSPYREGDLFIPAKAVTDAISGDRVRVAVQRKSGRGGVGSGGQTRGPAGRVLEVLERHKMRFTGTVSQAAWIMVRDSRRQGDP